MVKKNAICTLNLSERLGGEVVNCTRNFFLERKKRKKDLLPLKLCTTQEKRLRNTVELKLKYSSFKWSISGMKSTVQ